jgi:hypothetical protein
MPEAAERHRVGTMFDGQIGMCMETAFFMWKGMLLMGKSPCLFDRKTTFFDEKITMVDK